MHIRPDAPLQAQTANSLPKCLRPDSRPSSPCSGTATSSDTSVSWTSPSATTSTTSVSEPRNGVIRWYDPITGRWLSNDPIGISGGLNQYVFCANNPVNFRDPSGLCKDGDRFVQSYQNLIMTYPLPDILGIANALRTLSESAIDIGQTDAGSKWRFRGRIYPSNVMGNIAAGRILAEAHGIPFAIAELIAVELMTNEGGWPDAIGSFAANARGIASALRESPGSVIGNSINPILIYPNWAGYVRRNGGQMIQDNRLFSGDSFVTWPKTQ